MNKTALIILLLVSPLIGKTQNEDVDCTKVFHSMQEALKQPESVFHLDLSNQKLKELPEGLIQLTKLKSLNLSKNKLKNIHGIQLLKGLETLDLSKNNLNDFPLAATELYSLKSIDLGGNNLDSLPPQISNWRELEHFSAWGNRFNVIPSYIGKLESLKTLDFRAMLFSYRELDSIYSYLPGVEFLHDEGCDCD